MQSALTQEGVIQLIQHVISYLFAAVKYWTSNGKEVFQKFVENVNQSCSIDYISE